MESSKIALLMESFETALLASLSYKPLVCMPGSHLFLAGRAGQARGQGLSVRRGPPSSPGDDQLRFFSALQSPCFPDVDPPFHLSAFDSVDAGGPPGGARRRGCLRGARPESLRGRKARPPAAALRWRACGTHASPPERNGGGGPLVCMYGVWRRRIGAGFAEGSWGAAARVAAVLTARRASPLDLRATSRRPARADAGPSMCVRAADRLRIRAGREGRGCGQSTAALPPTPLRGWPGLGCEGCPWCA